MSSIRVNFDKIKNEVLPNLKARREHLLTEIRRYEANPSSRNDSQGRQMYTNLCNAYNLVCKRIAWFERITADFRTNINTVTETMNDIHIEELPTPSFTVQ